MIAINYARLSAESVLFAINYIWIMKFVANSGRPKKEGKLCHGPDRKSMENCR